MCVWRGEGREVGKFKEGSLSHLVWKKKDFFKKLRVAGVKCRGKSEQIVTGRKSRLSREISVATIFVTFSSFKECHYLTRQTIRPIISSLFDIADIVDIGQVSQCKNSCAHHNVIKSKCRALHH